jgi:hypothetical protein
MSPLLAHTTGITIDDAVWSVPKCKAFCAVSLLEWWPSIPVKFLFIFHFVIEMASEIPRAGIKLAVQIIM